MIEIVAFEPSHLDSLSLQAAQSCFEKFRADPEYAQQIADTGFAYTAREAGVTVAIAGVVPQGEHRAIAWALLSDTGPGSFVKIHRSVSRFLDAAPWKRIEAVVDCEFVAGHRWMEMLGFRREGTMRHYTPDGRHCDLYARIR